ncbi:MULTISPECIES: hypothetical protein [Burkholderia cepacia complex]|uniref:hypothetical protein n=1 Tax=Burkholderia cepacia complex TaxID=87882 RepID=UPI001CF28D3D|nr:MULTISPECIES: hypothetical protein [Burkholderia cepacia complex]MCA8076327.1 hypothetical protein [Burkholderia cepacia]HDR9164764.1 hypothetical protein [Burkholderia vietnamiensis]HDR9283768.1 hypothetical protein [Burkholderia vietnamiensis]
MATIGDSAVSMTNVLYTGALVCGWLAVAVGIYCIYKKNWFVALVALGAAAALLIGFPKPKSTANVSYREVPHIQREG